MNKTPQGAFRLFFQFSQMPSIIDVRRKSYKVQKENTPWEERNCFLKDVAPSLRGRE